MSPDVLAFLKFLLTVYLIIGYFIAVFGVQAIVQGAHIIKRQDRVTFLTPADLAVLFLRFMFLWGWSYIRPHWERAWRVY